MKSTSYARFGSSGTDYIKKPGGLFSQRPEGLKGAADRGPENPGRRR
jgi:hypothetical protein